MTRQNGFFYLAGGFTNQGAESVAETQYLGHFRAIYLPTR